jgi:hypothetical protein
MIRINVWMKLLTSVLLAAGTAFPQSSDRLPATTQRRSRTHCAPVPDSSPRTRLYSIGRLRPEASTPDVKIFGISYMGLLGAKQVACDGKWQ